ncbi:hypothetical protein Enr10x_53910 [Gimesia panareensis]|uniref:Uncharacterized protein n=1 Tax=Gimesia panareensis TaxID=2527978 RepID=A0A517QEG2_9PLAN|nr:hypothetical protein [Gimesia panareensis]QDT30032.1 hypothetical protein Enr10x_53910 [Gimesia panareensis]
MNEEACELCGSPTNVKVRNFKVATPPCLCARCHAVAKRRFNKFRGRKRDRIVDIPTRQDWIDALADAWDETSGCFRCRISRVPLELTNHKSPFYATAEHVAPGKRSEGFWVVAALINDMKSDLDFDEFKKVLPLLAQIALNTDKKTERRQLEQVMRKLRHWRR